MVPAAEDAPSDVPGKLYEVPPRQPYGQVVERAHILIAQQGRQVVGHVALAVIVDLTVQTAQLAPMFVPHESRLLVCDRVTYLQYLVEEVGVLATACWCARP